MALVSGGRSTLNPNAPLFIPAAVRQVEDFSPEWWELVTTSAWFQDYWLSQQQGEDGFYGNDGYDFEGTDDIAELLPDSIDLGTYDDFSSMEAQFEEFLQYTETGEANKLSFSGVKEMSQNGLASDAEALVKNLNLSKSGKERSPKNPKEAAKFWEKPGKSVGPRFSSHRIQQPR